jgi:hypothetical protein
MEIIKEGVFKVAKICMQYKKNKLYLYFNLKAIHNKDYSVVKTSKAGQLAFFIKTIPVAVVHWVVLLLSFHEILSYLQIVCR